MSHVPRDEEHERVFQAVNKKQDNEVKDALISILKGCIVLILGAVLLGLLLGILS